MIHVKGGRVVRWCTSSVDWRDRTCCKRKWPSVPEPEEVKALHRVLALTPAFDDTLYTSMGTEAPAYVLLTCAKSSGAVAVLLLVPLLKSAERAERKSDEKAPPEPFWLTMTRYCGHLIQHESWSYEASSLLRGQV